MRPPPSLVASLYGAVFRAEEYCRSCSQDDASELITTHSSDKLIAENSGLIQEGYVALNAHDYKSAARAALPC